jgi:UDP-N-acetylglucosamine transferase subunit ALG13
VKTGPGARVRRVMVSVGTDHHRFDRLMDWLESWMKKDGGTTAVTVQHGSSRCPLGATGHSFLPKDDLLELIAGADVVLLQGGPGGIMDSLRAGHKPIVVPRLAALNECVDDHQVTFGRHLARLDKILLVESEVELHRAIDRVLADPVSFRIQQSDAHVAATVERFASLVDGLLDMPVSRGRIAKLAATMRTAN